jgi:pyruvate/2-oxoacid:ferredoxin oxidoreductase alpha subunit
MRAGPSTGLPTFRLKVMSCRQNGEHTVTILSLHLPDIVKEMYDLTISAFNYPKKIVPLSSYDR